MIKAIIFDCFGVLITSALDPVLERLRNNEPKKAQALVDLLDAGSRGLIRPDDSLQQAADLLEMTTKDYRQLLTEGEVKDQRLLDYILQLRLRFKTGMLSNVSKDGLQRRFSQKELNEYFDIAVASADIGFAKPEARAYEYVADQLGVRLDECVFLDDVESYCIAAQGTGMEAIQYQGFEQAKAELEKLLHDAEG